MKIIKVFLLSMVMLTPGAATYFTFRHCPPWIAGLLVAAGCLVWALSKKKIIAEWLKEDDLFPHMGGKIDG